MKTEESPRHHNFHVLDTRSLSSSTVETNGPELPKKLHTKMLMRVNTAINTRDLIVLIPRNRVQKRNLGSQKVLAMKNFLGKLFGTDEKVDEVKVRRIVCWTCVLM